jgi:hypothetical protein
MRHRAMALLAGLILATQGSTQPVAAAVHPAVVSNVFADSERAPESSQTPDGPNASDSFSAGPLADLKVELESGWWKGMERHSRFKVANFGDAVATNISIRRQMYLEDLKLINNYYEFSDQVVGNLPPGTFKYFTVICTPPRGWVCGENLLRATSTGSDKNLANNYDEDHV